MQRALLLVNRHARRGRQGVHLAVEYLRQQGWQLLEASTGKREQISQAICEHRHRVDLVIVGGGDGTLNAALAGLVETQLPLGILPLGTANDLARTLGIPSQIQQACAVIQSRNQRQIDLGWVNGRYFCNVASLGISATITQQLTREAKHRWGVFAYAATALRVLRQTHPFRAEIHCDQQVWQGKTVQIAIGNGRFYGGGMAIAHDARIDDQRLDLYSLELQHWWQILPLLPAMGWGRQSQWPGVQSIQTQSLEVRTRRPQPINTDGELTTYTPARFRVLPQALTVLVPPGDAPGLSPSTET